jgi:hypothetical protein
MRLYDNWETMITWKDEEDISAHGDYIHNDEHHQGKSGSVFLEIWLDV